jgi:hypothetical protein
MTPNARHASRPARVRSSARCSAVSGAAIWETFQ